MDIVRCEELSDLMLTSLEGTVTSHPTFFILLLLFEKRFLYEVWFIFLKVVKIFYEFANF